MKPAEHRDEDQPRFQTWATELAGKKGARGGNRRAKSLLRAFARKAVAHLISGRPALTRRVGCSSTCPGSDYKPHGYRPAGLLKAGIPRRPLDPALWRVPPPPLHRWPDAACYSTGAVAKSK